MHQVCMGNKGNKPIRVSEKILKELRMKRDMEDLKSYNAVLKKLLEKEKKIK